MNQTEAKVFLTKLFNDIWTHGNPENVKQYYTEDIVAFFGSQQVGFDDIKNRAQLIKTKQQRFECEFSDVLSNDNKISFRVKQTIYDQSNQNLGEYNHLIFYHLLDGKINQIYAANSCDFDYRDLS